MNLVIQGGGLETADVSRVGAIAGSGTPERLTDIAWRLREVAQSSQIDAGIAAYCEARALDFAWVPEGRRFADLGLMAMDMDSTLITIECIDEIGGMLGIKPQIAAITERAMRGEIDYTKSLQLRVALLEGLDIGALGRVYDEKLRLSPGAESLVARAKQAGIKTLLVSGGFTFFTERIKERLGLDYALSNVLGIEDGKLTGRVTGPIVDAAAKAAHLARVARELGLAKEQTLAIGDGANDIPMLDAAGVSVAYRAKPVVRDKATHALSHSGLDGVLHLFE